MNTLDIITANTDFYSIIIQNVVNGYLGLYERAVIVILIFFVFKHYKFPYGIILVITTCITYIIKLIIKITINIRRLGIRSFWKDIDAKKLIEESANLAGRDIKQGKIYYLIKKTNHIGIAHGIGPSITMTSIGKDIIEYLRDTQTIIIGYVITVIARLIVSALFFQLSVSGDIYTKTIKYSTTVILPFLGSLSIVEYKDILGHVLGLGAFCILILIMIGGGFYTFSFRNRILKTIAMIFFIVSIVVFFVGVFFQNIRLSI